MSTKNGSTEALRGMYRTRAVETLGGPVVAAHAKPTERTPGKRGPAPRGLEGVMYRMETWQADALRRLAAERAAPAVQRGEKGARPDASELVREAVTAWLAEHDTGIGKRLATAYLKAQDEAARATLRRDYLAKRRG